VTEQGKVRLSDFDNAWYDPGRGVAVRVLWIMVNGGFFQTWLPWPSVVKRSMLRAFGAKIGAAVVIKPRVNIKYPWNIEVGDHAWIGEGVWIDSLTRVVIGANACVSQGVVIETGNHDWSKPTFDLKVAEVFVEEGAWAAVRSTLLPGSRLASHAVLAAGSCLNGDTEPYCVYSGVPATKIKQRIVRSQ
jgi:putative colanic acid biosynthesis acetyltransferase WcaF